MDNGVTTTGPLSNLTTTKLSYNVEPPLRVYDVTCIPHTLKLYLQLYVAAKTDRSGADEGDVEEGVYFVYS